MNTMMNLNENELAAVVGGIEINSPEATESVIPEYSIQDFENDPFPVFPMCPEITVIMDPTICNPTPVAPGIRLWDFVF